ncbi:MAG: hypothetical protein M1828_001870 [Chrysothrix sp. TS-e1954]|nr:MAG: hypothetical protein M1828_001870 [Chrysothrix sp. TS-e1954]
MPHAAPLPPEISHYLPSTTHPSRNSHEVLQSQTSQWLYTAHELLLTPSILDGMPPATERDLRYKGLNFITQVGVMLKLPQLTLGTASVYFNRFLMRHSLVSPKHRQPRPNPPKPSANNNNNPHDTAAATSQKSLHHFTIAAISLHLSTKTSETPRKLKELIVACCRIAQRKPDLLIDEQSKDFWKWRDQILNHEDLLLESLCFDLEVTSPHAELRLLLGRLGAAGTAAGAAHEKPLRNRAWSLVSDSCATPACLRFSARQIAVSGVYIASRLSHHSSPPSEETAVMAFRDDDEGQPWWTAHSVSLSAIHGVCTELTSFYEHQSGGKVDGERDWGERMSGWSLEDAERDPTRLRGERDPSRLKGEAGVESGVSTPGSLLGAGAGAGDAGGPAARAPSVKRERDGTPKLSGAAPPPPPPANLPVPPVAAVAAAAAAAAASGPPAPARDQQGSEQDGVRDIDAKLNNNPEDTSRTLSPRKRLRPSSPRAQHDSSTSTISGSRSLHRPQHSNETSKDPKTRRTQSQDQNTHAPPAAQSALKKEDLDTQTYARSSSAPNGSGNGKPPLSKNHEEFGGRGKRRGGGGVRGEDVEDEREGEGKDEEGDGKGKDEDGAGSEEGEVSE